VQTTDLNEIARKEGEEGRENDPSWRKRELRLGWGGGKLCLSNQTKSKASDPVSEKTEKEGLVREGIKIRGLGETGGGEGGRKKGKTGKEPSLQERTGPGSLLTTKKVTGSTGRTTKKRRRCRKRRARQTKERDP